MNPLKSLYIVVALLGAVPAVAAERAIWTWEESSYEMVRNEAAGDAAIEFLLSRKVDTIYLYADAYRGRNLLLQRPALYRSFIRRLHRSGVRAYALLGSAYLHTEEYVLPERRDDAIAMFQRVLAYNASSEPEERFDGVNLDIEPHILDQWSEHKLRLLGQFLDLGQALMGLKRASGQALEVGPAIPFWLDGIELDWQGATRPVSEHMQDLYDYVALMDYRNQAAGRDGIISHAASEMAYAGRNGRKVVIGIEVSPGEMQKLTFDHLGVADFERELALTMEAFRDQPAFGGFAIHHFRTYRTWVARQPRP